VLHADPEKREWRDDLWQLGRVPTLRDAVGNARLIEQLDGIAHETVVA
jgi:hypothetical protein